MWLRHDQSPALRPDPLDISGNIALRVPTVLKRSGLVPQHQRAKEHLPQRIAREDRSDLALRSGQFGEALELALLLDAAVECRIAHVGKHPDGLRTDLDHPAAI